MFPMILIGSVTSEVIKSYSAALVSVGSLGMLCHTQWDETPINLLPLYIMSLSR